ncbi:MAG: BACON domain-containing protein, partial [Acidobacteriia bacterium]|nr:BACON domain-containing protein [Terriglobia bacterium]
MRRALLLIPFLALFPAFAQTTCVFTISPTIVSVPARGSSPDGSFSGVVQISASAGSCPRTSVSNVPEWISISFGSPGTGNGSTGYTVKPNTNPTPRTGTVQIAGQLLTVNQAAASCTFQLTSSRTRFAADGGSATLTIVTSCSWTAASDVAWIVFAPHVGGPGNGSVPFNVIANPAASERTGHIQIGSQSVSITQTAAGCVFSLSPSSANI